MTSSRYLFIFVIFVFVLIRDVRIVLCIHRYIRKNFIPRNCILHYTFLFQYPIQQRTELFSLHIMLGLSLFLCV